MSKPTLTDCIIESLQTPGFVDEFNRLTGSELFVDARSRFDKEIDKATGYIDVLAKEQEEYFWHFCHFVNEFVFQTLPEGK